MKFFLLTGALCMLPHSSYSGSIEESHFDAMEALEQCKNTLLQSKREAALKHIEDAGLDIAVALNPSSRTAQRDFDMLAEVTEALRQCTGIVFSK